MKKKLSCGLLALTMAFSSAPALLEGAVGNSVGVVGVSADVSNGSIVVTLSDGADASVNSAGVLDTNVVVDLYKVTEGGAVKQTAGEISSTAQTALATVTFSSLTYDGDTNYLVAITNNESETLFCPATISSSTAGAVGDAETGSRIEDLATATLVEYYIDGVYDSYELATDLESLSSEPNDEEYEWKVGSSSGGDFAPDGDSQATDGILKLYAATPDDGDDVDQITSNTLSTLVTSGIDIKEGLTPVTVYDFDLTAGSYNYDNITFASSNDSALTVGKTTDADNTTKGITITPVAVGTSTITAKATVGGVDDTVIGTWNVEVENSSNAGTHVPVTSIAIDVTEITVEESATLVATVTPSDATNQTIAWSITKDTDSTGSSINESTGVVTAGADAGTIEVTATITGGGDGVDYTKTFEIEIKAEEFVPVTDIEIDVEKFIAGQDTTLSATITPLNATKQTIAWSIADNGSTGASIDSSTGIITGTNSTSGTIEVTATITDGVNGDGDDYEKTFTIDVIAVTIDDGDLALNETALGSVPAVSAADVTTSSDDLLASLDLTNSATGGNVKFEVVAGDKSVIPTDTTLSYSANSFTPKITIGGSIAELNDTAAIEIEMTVSVPKKEENDVYILFAKTSSGVVQVPATFRTTTPGSEISLIDSSEVSVNVSYEITDELNGATFFTGVAGKYEENVTVDLGSYADNITSVTFANASDSTDTVTINSGNSWTITSGTLLAGINYDVTVVFSNVYVKDNGVTTHKLSFAVGLVYNTTADPTSYTVPITSTTPSTKSVKIDIANLTDEEEYTITLKEATHGFTAEGSITGYSDTNNSVTLSVEHFDDEAADYTITVTNVDETSDTKSGNLTISTGGVVNVSGTDITGESTTPESDPTPEADSTPDNSTNTDTNTDDDDTSDTLVDSNVEITTVTTESISSSSFSAYTEITPIMSFKPTVSYNGQNIKAKFNVQSGKRIALFEKNTSGAVKEVTINETTLAAMITRGLDGVINNNTITSSSSSITLGFSANVGSTYTLAYVSTTNYNYYGGSSVNSAAYYDSGALRINGTYITELRNVLVGEMINLNYYNVVNGKEVLGWYYDEALTREITNPSQFVVTSDILANGIYAKLTATVSDTLVDGSVNAGAGTTTDTYVPSTVPSTIAKLLGKLF